MKKIIINPGELISWQEKSWKEYSSQTMFNTRLSIKTNMLGEYLVTYGDEKLYRGTNIFNAVKSYNMVENIAD